MRAATLALAVLTVGACGRPAPNAAAPDRPSEAPAVMAIPAELQGGVEGRGTEPFWAVTVAGGQIDLQRPDHPPLTAGASNARAVEGAAVWDGRSADAPLQVSARVQPGCSDGMSDLVYPLAVEVRIGGDVLRGCGAPAGQMPRGER